jgi:predicted  nucleic acid-binding Zn-ribbon protein
LEQLQNIQQKIEQLIAQYQQLHNEKERLQKKLLTTEQQLHDKEELVASMQQDLRLLKENGNNLNKKTKKDIELKINACYADIDKCIALLNNK